MSQNRSERLTATGAKLCTFSPTNPKAEAEATKRAAKIRASVDFIINLVLLLEINRE